MPDLRKRKTAYASSRGVYSLVLRKHSITASFIGAVALFFESGFTHLVPIHPVSQLPQSANLRNGGPGAETLALSFVKEQTQRWIFVIDDQSGSTVQYVTMNKAYVGFLEKAGLKPDVEKRNTANYKVKFGDLPALLKVMTDEEVNDIDKSLAKHGQSLRSR